MANYGSIRPRMDVFRKADALRQKLGDFSWNTFLIRACASLEKTESKFLENPSQQEDEENEKEDVAILEPVEN